MNIPSPFHLQPSRDPPSCLITPTPWARWIWRVEANCVGGSHPNTSPSLATRQHARHTPSLLIRLTRAADQSQPTNQPHPLRARTRSLQAVLCKPLPLLTRHGGRIKPQGQARPGQTRAGQAETNGGCCCIPPHRRSTLKPIPSGLGRFRVASASQAGRVRAKGRSAGGRERANWQFAHS